MLILYIFVIAVSLGVFKVSYMFSASHFEKIFIKKKLAKAEAIEGIDTTQKTSEAIYLYLNPIKNRILNFTPKNIKSNLESLVNVIGIKWTVGDIVLLKFLIALVCVILGFVFSSIILNVRNSLLQLSLIAIISLIGFLGPDLYLKRKANLRKRIISRELPYFIDYLTIAVEAGLGLDISILRVISQSRGPLEEEMAFAMNEIKYGKSKKEAFSNLAGRLNLRELTVFLSALINGEKLGIALSTILKTQSKQIREQQKQKIHTEANKVPIKLVFPLVLFILPSIFIVLLGPAAINIFNVFIK